MRPLLMVVFTLSALALFLYFTTSLVEKDADVNPDVNNRLDAIMRRLDALDTKQADNEMLMNRVRRDLENRVIEAQQRGGMNPLSEPEVNDPTREAPAAVAESKPEFDLAALLKDLDNPNLTDKERQAIWARLMAAGKAKDALELMEARAEERGHDADAQADLAELYGEMIKAGNLSQAELGDLAGKADGLYDKALEIDNQHWRARFNKAVSLSFWPAALGKGPEAVKHLEVLLDQQRGHPAESKHAYTHFFLGNLYMQSGRSEKAIEVWRDGLARFPDHEDLARQLKVHGK